MKRIIQPIANQMTTRSAENPGYWTFTRKLAGKPKDNIDPITKLPKPQELDLKTNLPILTDIDYSGVTHGLLGNKDIDELLELKERNLAFVECTLTHSGKHDNTQTAMINSHGILEGQSKPQYAVIHEKGALVRTSAIEEHLPGTNVVQQDYQKKFLNELPLPSKSFYQQEKKKSNDNQQTPKDKKDNLPENLPKKDNLPFTPED